MSRKMDRIILASASPRRRELLEQVGIPYEVMPVNADETITETNPALAVEELSRRKALEGMKQIPADTRDTVLVIGADTVVAREGQILGKPLDKEEAFAMLNSLQGKKHQVYTGVTIAKRVSDGQIFCETFHEETLVEVVPMTEEEIWGYIATGEPMDKAGAYGIQGAFAAYIKGIRGDFYNVVGLPVCLTVQKLRALSLKQ